MGKDYVLISVINDGDSRVYLESYDKELFEELDSHDAHYEYDHWDLDRDYLDLGSSLYNGKIVMIRTIFYDLYGYSRDVNRI